MIRDEMYSDSKEMKEEFRILNRRIRKMCDENAKKWDEFFCRTDLTSEERQKGFEQFDQDSKYLADYSAREHAKIIRKY